RAGVQRRCSVRTALPASYARYWWVTRISDIWRVRAAEPTPESEAGNGGDTSADPTVGRQPQHVGPARVRLRGRAGRRSGPRTQHPSSDAVGAEPMGWREVHGPETD